MNLGNFIQGWLYNIDAQGMIFIASIIVAVSALSNTKGSFKKAVIGVIGSWGFINLIMMILFVIEYKGK